MYKKIFTAIIVALLAVATPQSSFATKIENTEKKGRKESAERSESDHQITKEP